jgi:hypothetical protein
MATEETKTAVGDAYDSDPHYTLKVARGFLVGNQFREPGELVSLPRERAIQAIEHGIAVASGVRATASLAFVRAFRATPPKPPTAPLGVGRLIRVIEGVFTCGAQSRSFTPADGVVTVYTEVPLECLVESQPAPGSGERRSRTVVELQLPAQEIQRVVADKKRAQDRSHGSPVGPTGCTVGRGLPSNR